MINPDNLFTKVFIKNKALELKTRQEIIDNIFLIRNNIIEEKTPPPRDYHELLTDKLLVVVYLDLLTMSALKWFNHYNYGNALNAPIKN